MVSKSRLFQRYANGETRLHRAVSRGRYDEAVMLLDAGLDPNARSRDGYPVLACVPSIGDDTDRFTRLLLQRGAQVNLASSKTGDTALLRAAQDMKPARIALLLDAGADPNQANAQGEYPLDKAVYGFVCGYYRTAKAAAVWQRLMDASGLALASNQVRWSALHQALSYLFQEDKFTDKGRRQRAQTVFEALVAAGAHLEVRRAWDSVPRTPLREALHAVESTHRSVAEHAVRHLIEQGAQVEPEEGDGYLHDVLRGGLGRPLSPAIRWIVHTLIQAGASVSRCNEQGETVEDVLARRGAHGLIAELAAERMNQELPAPQEKGARMRL